MAYPLKIAGRRYVLVVTKRLDYVASAVARRAERLPRGRRRRASRSRCCSASALTTTLLRRLERLRDATRELERRGPDAQPAARRTGATTRSASSRARSRACRRACATRRTRGARSSRRPRTSCARRSPRSTACSSCSTTTSPPSTSTSTTRASASRAPASSRAGSRSWPPTCSTSAASTPRSSCAASRSSSARSAARSPPSSSCAAAEREVAIEVAQPPAALLGAGRPRRGRAHRAHPARQRAARRAGRVEHRAVADRAARSRAQIVVSRRGPGVPDDERELIFERFQRGSATGGRSGFGLGPGDRPRARLAHGRLARAGLRRAPREPASSCACPSLSASAARSARRHEHRRADTPMPAREHVRMSRRRPQSRDSADAIDESGVLCTLAAQARAGGRLALDTEFMGEGRYRTLLCLVQLVVADETAGLRIELIDPLREELDGAPLAALLADPADRGRRARRPPGRRARAPALRDRGAQRLRHAGRRRLRRAGRRRLVRDAAAQLLGVRVSKSASFTRWDARPLSAEQLAYAREDVVHLLELAAELQRRLARARAPGVGAPGVRARSSAPATCATSTRSSRACRASAGLNAASQAVARELVEWRERTAAAGDRPVQSVLSDAVLVEIAKRRPTTHQRARADPRRRPEQPAPPRRRGAGGGAAPAPSARTCAAGATGALDRARPDRRARWSRSPKRSCARAPARPISPTS